MKEVKTFVLTVLLCFALSIQCLAADEYLPGGSSVSGGNSTPSVSAGTPISDDEKLPVAVPSASNADTQKENAPTQTDFTNNDGTPGGSSSVGSNSTPSISAGTPAEEKEKSTPPIETLPSKTTTTSRTESSVREVVGQRTEIINIDGLDVPLADGSSVYIPFVDIAKDAYYAEAVAWAYKHDPQITAGVTELSFGPNQTCTRGQMVTFLWRAAGCPEPSGDASRFVDVAAGAYYAKAVAWAVENNITDGVGDGKFDPNGIVNRAQAVTFLYRAKGKPAVTSAAQFTDVAAGEYYADAVAWAVANEVTNGVSDNSFAPNNNCVRGQTVTFLYRAYK